MIKETGVFATVSKCLKCCKQEGTEKNWHAQMYNVLKALKLKELFNHNLLETH